jgi:chemotaxis protein methyltransferase CheR
VLDWLAQKIKERKQRPSGRKGNKVTLWSAASSTGQEAFSMGMCIDKFCSAHAGIEMQDFIIKATDISNEILSKAMTGRYREFDVKRGLSPELLNAYFSKDEDSYVVAAEILKCVNFQYLNLIEDFSSLGGIDVIFCRNVLIYFDEDTRKSILSRMYELMSPGGYLFLGAMESMYHLGLLFESEQIGKTTAYRKLPLRG